MIARMAVSSGTGMGRESKYHMPPKKRARPTKIPRAERFQKFQRRPWPSAMMMWLSRFKVIWTSMIAETVTENGRIWKPPLFGGGFIELTRRSGVGRDRLVFRGHCCLGRFRHVTVCCHLLLARSLLLRVSSRG